jgi:hypothetical protein
MSALGEFYRLRFRNDHAREELHTLRLRQVAAFASPDKARPRTLLLTGCELNKLHGTGVLLHRIFDPAYTLSVGVRRSHWVAGDFREVLVRPRDEHDAIAEEELGILADAFQPDQVVVVPHFQEEVWAALLLARRIKVPLVTWVMDDPCLIDQRISKDLLDRLFAVSSLRFAISGELRDGLAREFRHDFFVLPPVVDALRETYPAVDTSENVSDRRCAMLGNMWSDKILPRFVSLLTEAGWKVDWFGSPQNTRLSDRGLPEGGIREAGYLPDDRIVEILAKYPFAVVPVADEEMDATGRAFARFSLPSRIPFLTAGCRIPVLVAGDVTSCAARFVQATGTGVACAYDAAAFRAASGELLSRSQSLRDHCASLAEAINSRDIDLWLMKGALSGKPGDDRFERLIGARN